MLGRGRRDRGGCQERGQPRPRAIVGAVGAQHEQLFQAQVRLHRAQGLDLAADTDEEQAGDGAGLDARHNLRQQLQGRGERGFDARGRPHLGRRAGEDRAWGQGVARLARHARHRVHQAGLQGRARQGRDDARPLRPRHGRGRPRIELILHNPQLGFLPAHVPGPAVQGGLQGVQAGHALP